MEEVNLKYDELSSRDKEEFKRVCNKLLSCCLLCKKKEDTRKDYYFIENYRDAINEYLEPLGYEVELNKTISAVQLINKYGHNRLKLKLGESITLLILRILYHEKMEDISLSDKVVVEVSEIQDKFVALGFKDKLMDKTLLKQSIAMLKRFNIVEPLDSNITLGDSRIVIYPSILMAVRMDEINNVYDKLSTYTRNEVKSDEEIDGD